MRASAAVEKAGIPTVSLVCDGFLGQATAIVGGLGMTDLALARVPGHVDSQSDAELSANVLETTVPDIVHALTTVSSSQSLGHMPCVGPVGIDAEFDAVNEAFEQRGWTDGLPVVPPTVARVEAFLAQIDGDPERIIGCLLYTSDAADE